MEKKKLSKKILLRLVKNLKKSYSLIELFLDRWNNISPHKDQSGRMKKTINQSLIEIEDKLFITIGLVEAKLESGKKKKRQKVK